MNEIPKKAPRLSMPDEEPQANLQKAYNSRHHKLRKIVFASQAGICNVCLDQSCQHLHHIDGNPFNTKRDNLLGVCEACHIRLHGKKTNEY